MMSLGQIIKTLSSDEIIGRVRTVLKQFKENTKNLDFNDFSMTKYQKGIWKDGFLCPSSGRNNYTFMLRKGEDTLYKNVFGSGLEKVSVDERNLEDARLFYRGFLTNIADLYEEIKEKTGVDVVSVREILPSNYTHKVQYGNDLEMLRGLYEIIIDEGEKQLLSDIIHAPFGKLKIKSLYKELSEVPEKDFERIDDSHSYYSSYNKPETLEKGKEYTVYGVSFERGLLFFHIQPNTLIPVSYPACYFEVTDLKRSKYWVTEEKENETLIYPPSWLKYEYFGQDLDEGKDEVVRDWEEDMANMDSE